MLATAAAAAALGIALGAITGIPLGVINLAISDAAIAGRRRFATGLGIGGGLADTVHAALAFAGFGSAIAAHRDAQRVAAVIAAVAIGTYAVRAWRQRPVRAVPLADAAPHDRLATGIATGVALTLPNPAALAAWVAVAAALWPDAPLPAALMVAAGVGIGSAAWFTLLARWIATIAATRPDHRALRIVPRVALVALVVIAIGGAVRAL